MASTRRGPIETKVRADVEALMTAHPMGESLAEVAFGLSRRLDGDLQPMAVAGVTKELREILCELADKAVDGDDDLAAALSVPTSFRDGP